MTQDYEKVIQEFEEKIKVGFSAAGVVNFFVSFAMAYALKYLWNMVNLFQFLVFVEKWQLNYPPNAKVFLQNIKSLVLMEFVPTEDVSLWISDKLGLSECAEDDYEC